MQFYRAFLHHEYKISRSSRIAVIFFSLDLGAEMNLLIEKHGKIVGAFEIKSTTQVTGAHLGGLRSFRQEYPQVPLQVIARVEQAYRLDEVQVTHWKECCII